MDCVLESRQAAFRILKAIVFEQKTSDEAFRIVQTNCLSDSDRQFVRLLVLTTLRRYGQTQEILRLFMAKPLPTKRRDIGLILTLGIAQLLFLGTPAHAAVDTSVRLARYIKQPAFTRLVNGVLRQIERQKDTIVMPPCSANLPDELKNSWEQVYGKSKTNAIAEVLVTEPPLDITVKENPEKWAVLWQGNVLPTGSVRVESKSGIVERAGYETGDWWVQEASASIPVQLFPSVKGLRVADLCAAPGGKTAQLAVRGAFVDAYDISEKRLERLMENMKRLQLADFVRVKCGDALQIEVPAEGLYDCVLLDAPCSATGTIRRHPDLLFHRTMADINRLSQLQRQLLQKAWTLLKPNGYLVYATCSLQQEENETVVQWFVNQTETAERIAVSEKWRSFMNDKGAVQVTPIHNQDGFYAVLLHKK